MRPSLKLATIFTAAAPVAGVTALALLALYFADILLAPNQVIAVAWVGGVAIVIYAAGRGCAVWDVIREAGEWR